MKMCPKCEKPLLKVSGGIVAKVKQGQSVSKAPGQIVWETYTCQNKDCEYYNKKLVWDKLKNTWEKLP